MNNMTETTAFGEAFLRDWYRKIDGKAPFSELARLTVGEGLVVDFPNNPLDMAGFERWYAAQCRARKIQRFLSQPFSVAEQFTGMQGKYVPIKETVRGFKEILEGKHDDLPESAFLFVGTIDEAVEKAKQGAAK